MTAKGATVEMEFADPWDTIIKQPSPVAAEIKLWLCVLELTWRDATGSHRDNRYPGEAEHDKADARAWFASNEAGPGSLKWIIQMTGIPTTAASLRRRVLAR